MTWPWQRLRSSDHIIGCPCGSKQPALALRPLSNMVRRGSSIIRVMTGTEMGCLACGQSYYVATAGVSKGVFQVQPLALKPTMADLLAKQEQRKKQTNSAPAFSRPEMLTPP